MTFFPDLRNVFVVSRFEKRGIVVDGGFSVVTASAEVGSRWSTH